MPREIALLTNPSAGKGRASRVVEPALQRLREAGLLVRNLRGRSGEEAADLARQCVEEGIESLVVIGGDGIVHLAVQAVTGTDTRLGVVPAGTGNDFARSLCIPRNDPAAALDVVISGRSRRIDLARVGHRCFVTVLAAGFDAVVSERANRMRWPRGQMRYQLATLAALRVFEPIPYVMDVDGVEHRFDAMLVAVGNGPSFGGGLRITEGALLDDGLLDVVVIGAMGKRELVVTYPKLFTGTHVTHPAYRHYSGRRITLAAPGITAYADGERMAPLPLTVEVAPAALEVLVP